MSSSQYNTCSALHRSSQGVQLWNPEQTPLTHRVGQLDTIDSEKETHDPCAQTLLLTGAPGCPTESATGSRQCNSLQCSLVHGSGRLFPTPLTELDRRARGTRPQDTQTNKPTNEFKDKPTSKRYARGGRKSGWRVCVWWWGRQHSAILSHLSWADTGTAPKHTNTTGRELRAVKLSANRDEKGESKRRPAAAGGRGRQGRQQRTGGEKAARAKEVGACSSNGVQRGVPDHPRANTSVQEGKAPEQHPQHGVEGRPHIGPKPLLP